MLNSTESLPAKLAGFLFVRRGLIGSRRVLWYFDASFFNVVEVSNEQTSHRHHRR
jgi:hypothetical protein